MIKGRHNWTRALVAGAAASALLLSGCSGGDETATGSTTPVLSKDPVTIRFVWWGSDDRTKATLAAVDAFEKEYPNITVETESLPFDGYFDRLSTQLAANDAPDVQQLTGDFIVDYGSRGALLDLTSVDITKVDEATTKSAHIDGEQRGIPTGLATPVIVANPILFEAAGVDMPDDSTWTWDDFETIAQDISDNSADGIFGSQALGTDAAVLTTWIRQQGKGKKLYDADGLAFTAPDVASFYTLLKRMVDDGAMPPADEAVEQTAISLEQTGLAANRYAMGFWSSNQLTSLEAVSGDGLKILRIPSTDGTAKGAKMAFGASQYWAASSRTKHPAEAQLLIDYLTNSVTAGKALLVGRGSPANSEVREAVTPLLSESDAQIVTFIDDIAGDVVASEPAAPAGLGTFQDNLRRYTSEVLFERMTPKEAAEGLVSETEASLK